MKRYEKMSLSELETAELAAVTIVSRQEMRLTELTELQAREGSGSALTQAYAAELETVSRHIRTVRLLCIAFGAIVPALC